MSLFEAFRHPLRNIKSVTHRLVSLTVRQAKNTARDNLKKLEQARSSASDNLKMLEQARKSAEKYRKARNDAVAARDAARDAAGDNLKKLNELRSIVNFLKPYNIILPKLHRIQEKSTELHAEAIIAISAESMPHAIAARGKKETPIFCDATEFPALDVRTLVPDWPEANMQLMNMAMKAYLRECKGILTVGWELEKSLKEYNVPTKVIPNYRYTEKYEQSNKLRDEFGLDKNCKIIIAISTIATGLEDVLFALSNLPSDFHLVIVGNIVRDQYKQKILDFADRLQIRNRFWIRDQVPYPELTSYISAANVGLIVRDPEIKNNFVSLPNRVFDYMFGGIPVVAPFMPDIDRIITRNNFGLSLQEMSAIGWEKAILKAQEKNSEFRQSALDATKRLTWENVEGDLLEFLARPRSVTIIGQKNLINHNRTMRIARTLVENGSSVKLALDKGYIKDNIPKEDDLDFIGF